MCKDGHWLAKTSSMIENGDVGIQVKMAQRQSNSDRKWNKETGKDNMKEEKQL